MSKSQTDLVLLVPGFLGFEVIADLAYFHPTFVTSLETALGELDGRRFRVEALDTVPAGSLRQRQLKLVQEIKNLLVHHDPGGCLHLVGHSAGGVDGRLLLAHKPIGDASWDELDARVEQLRTSAPQKGPHVKEIRERIASMTGIASPHRGTWLATHPDVTAIHANPASLLVRLAHELEVTVSILLDKSAWRLLPMSPLDLMNALAFVHSVVEQRDLIRDLSPAEMTREGAPFDVGAPAQPPATGARFRSIMTLTGKRVPSELSAWLRRMRLASFDDDVLFRWLRARTEPTNYDDLQMDDADRDADGLALAQLQEVVSHNGQPGVPLIVREGTSPRELSPVVSDAVVTSVRQLFDPSDEHELAAVVIGDHLDVVGHYDHEPGLAGLFDREDEGFIRSGSRFSRTELDGLTKVIANEVKASLAHFRRAAGGDVLATG